MALPTISYQGAGAATGASAISVIGPKLHTMLVNAGWSIEWADADAIGSGSGSNPAWDKSYSSGAAAGTVVYKMPKNGHTTAWFVKFSLGWGTAADRVTPRFVQCGVTHDGNGNLSGGSGITVATGSSSSANLGHHISVSEDGFAIAWDGNVNTAPCLIVERERTAGGTVTDDMITVLKAATASQAYRTYSAAGGENASRNTLYWFRVADAGALSTPSPLVSGASGDGLDAVIVGPYFTGGDITSGPPRHAVYLPNGDVALGATVSLSVDGAERVYQLLTQNHYLGVLAVAKD